MKSWHPNSAKHKSNHRDYKGRPTKKQVIALLEFYSPGEQMARVSLARQEDGAQLRMDLL